MCEHFNVIKCEEANIVTTIYRRTKKGRYKLEKGSTTSGRGIVKWVCLDCVTKIEAPKSKDLVAW